jgi:site-specific recombinase XerD
MLEYFYKERRTLVDFRRGPLGPHFDEFAASLKEKGYVPATAAQILSRCHQFSHFLVERDVTQARSINPTLIESFLKVYLAGSRSSRPHITNKSTRLALRHLFSYLVDCGVLTKSEPRLACTPYSWALDPFLEHLRREREISEHSVAQNSKIISAFLKGLGSQASRQALKGLRPESVEQYFRERIEGNCRNQVRMGSALRSFLRFCAVKRYTTQDLSGMVPPIPRYKLASLPRGIEDQAVKRLLATMPQGSMTGCRNYAMVLLMAAYGLRAAQVVKLRLEDIHWPRSTIRIGAAKGGKEVLLPLLGSVGEALLSYLRHRPANSPFREVFLSVHAPFVPLSGLAVSLMTRIWLRKIGIKAPRAGSSMLRHSWAIRALAHDTSIKAIADVMGHRWLHTTFIYAKADLKTLRQAAASWPEAIR